MAILPPGSTQQYLDIIFTVMTGVRGGTEHQCYMFTTYSAQDRLHNKELSGVNMNVNVYVNRIVSLLRNLGSESLFYLSWCSLLL